MANRQIRVEIIGDSRSLERAFKRSERSAQTFNARMSGVGTSLAKGGAFAAGTARAVAFTAALKVGLDEMMRSAAVAADTVAALKSTGAAAGVTARQIEGLGTRLQQLSGYDDEAIRSAENLLLTFTNVRNVAGRNNDVFSQTIKSTLDLSRRFKQDLSTSAVQLGKALQDPVRGVTALRRAGIGFSAQQQRMINRLVDTGRLLEAQKILLREVRVQTGGAAEAYGKTLPGALDILQGNLENIAGELAETLAPEMKKLTDQFNKWLANPQNKKQIIEGFATATHTLGEAFEFAAGTAGLLKDAANKIPTDMWKRILPGVSQLNQMKDLADILGLGGGGGGGKPVVPAGVAGPVGSPSKTAALLPGLTGPLTGAAAPGTDVVKKALGGETPMERRQRLKRLNNQWFDAAIGRQLVDVQDVATVKGQIARLREISAQVTARIGVTKDITRKLNLEDQVKSIGRERRGLQEQLAAIVAEAKQDAAKRGRLRTERGIERQFGWLAFAAERAEATKTISDDLKVQHKIEAALKARIAAEGRKLELVSELWRTRQKIKELGKGPDRDPLAGLMQASSKQVLAMLSKGTGLDAMGRSALRGNISGLNLRPIHIENVIKLDEQIVGRSVTRHQARDSQRTAKQTSGFRG